MGVVVIRMAPPAPQVQCWVNTIPSTHLQSIVLESVAKKETDSIPVGINIDIWGARGKTTAQAKQYLLANFCPSPVVLALIIPEKNTCKVTSDISWIPH